MKKGTWLLAVLFVAVVAIGAKLFLAPCQRTAGAAQLRPAELVIQNIMMRKSVRNYTAEPIAKDALERLVRAGMAAPTAGNKQPWKFVVIDQRALLDALAGKLPYAKMLARAPAAIAVCGDMTKTFPDKPDDEYWIQDCSAASENILLAAEALGLGAVWTGVYPVSDRVAAVQEILHLDKKLVPLNVIAVGHPAGGEPPKDKWKPENLLWNRQ